MINKNEALLRNYEKLGKNEKAVDVVNNLLMLMSSNSDYYWKVLELKGLPKPKNANDILSEAERSAALEILRTYQGLMPK